MRVKGLLRTFSADAPLYKDKLDVELDYSTLRSKFCPIEALFGLPSCRFSRKRLGEIPEVNSISDHQPETALMSLYTGNMPGMDFTYMSLTCHRAIRTDSDVFGATLDSCV